MILKQNFRSKFFAATTIGLGVAAVQACANAPAPDGAPPVDTTGQNTTNGNGAIDTSTGNLGTGTTTAGNTATTGTVPATGATDTTAGVGTTATDTTATTMTAMPTGAGGAAGTTTATAAGGTAPTTAAGGAAMAADTTMTTTTAAGGAATASAAGGAATTTVADTSTAAGDDCSTTPAAATTEQSITPTAAGVADIGVYAVFTYGDGTTTMGLCGSAGEVCISGTVAAHGADYSNWGGGLGFQFAQGTTAYDASAFTGVSFTLSGTIPTSIRPGITLTANDEKGFIVGTGADDTFAASDISAAGAQTLSFAALVQPPESWGGDPTLTWDPSDIKSVQFQINAGETAGAFDFCISNLAFQ